MGTPSRKLSFTYGKKIKKNLTTYPKGFPFAFWTAPSWPFQDQPWKPHPAETRKYNYDSNILFRPIQYGNGQCFGTVTIFYGSGSDF
jgi:hypothetical protein